MTILTYWISAFYKKSLDVFMVIYLFEFGLLLVLYSRLKSKVPLQLDMNGVVAVTAAKYVVLLVPIAGMVVGFLLKPEFIDSKYIADSLPGSTVKILFFLIQVLLVAASLSYLYIVLTAYLK